MLLILEDGGLQVHWTGRCRPVYKEVVEVHSNYKISSFWWFRNLTYGDSTGSNWIEKDKIVYLLDMFVRMVAKRQCDLVCGAPLDDWANAGPCWCPRHVHVVSAVLTFWVVGLFLRNGCGILGQNACFIALGEWNVSWVTLRDIASQNSMSIMIFYRVLIPTASQWPCDYCNVVSPQNSQIISQQGKFCFSLSIVELCS